MCSTIIIFAKLQIISVIFIFSALLKGNCATEFPLFLYIYGSSDIWSDVNMRLFETIATISRVQLFLSQETLSNIS